MKFILSFAFMMETLPLFIQYSFKCLCQFWIGSHVLPYLVIVFIAFITPSFFISKVYSLFYILTAVSLPLFPFHPPTSPLQPNPHASPLFLYRKGQASLGYRQSIAYTTEVGLSSSPSIKAVQGNPVWGTGSQTPVKVLSTDPAPTVRNPASGPRYTTVTHM